MRRRPPPTAADGRDGVWTRLAVADWEPTRDPVASNDLLYQFDYAGDPTKVVIDLSDSHV